LKRLILLVCVSLPASARAEIAVLGNGMTLKVSSHRLVDGDQVDLTLKGGGEVELPKDAVQGFVPDEVLDEVPPGKSAAEVRSLVRDIALRRGLPPELVLAVVAVESGFQPDAVSRKGAQGLMQLMPGTASALGVRDAFDPVQNVDGGTRYLSSLLALYGGDPRRALAAYNAGEGAVRRHGGVPPFKETQDYVRAVLRLSGQKP
jgi:soluble lytic murein transglycosylase-like protein